MQKGYCGGLSLVLALGLSLGCQSRYTKERVAQISLDHTTDAEIVKLFGRPRENVTIVKGADTSKLYNYTKVYARGVGPVIMGYFYHLSVETRDGVAVGYLYARSDDDATRFDTKKAEQVIEGRTTRSELLALLGPPAGMAESHSLLPDYKHVQGKGDTQILAWADAVPASYFVKGGTVPLTLLIVEIGSDQRVVTKAVETASIGN